MKSLETNKIIRIVLNFSSSFFGLVSYIDKKMGMEKNSFVQLEIKLH